MSCLIFGKQPLISIKHAYVGNIHDEVDAHAVVVGVGDVVGCGYVQREEGANIDAQSSYCMVVRRVIGCLR